MPLQIYFYHFPSSLIIATNNSTFHRFIHLITHGVSDPKTSSIFTVTIDTWLFLLFFLSHLQWRTYKLEPKRHRQTNESYYDRCQANLHADHTHAIALMTSFKLTDTSYAHTSPFLQFSHDKKQNRQKVQNIYKYQKHATHL